MENGSRVGGPGPVDPEDRLILRAERFSDAFGLLLVLLLATCALSSLLGDSGWPAVLTLAFSGLTSAVALIGSHSPRRLVLAGAGLAAVALVLGAVAATSGADLWLNLAGVITVILFAASAAAVLMRVLTSDEVTTRTIVGALSVYILIGILFSALYVTLNRIEDGAFFAGHVTLGHGDFLFFSVTTLTTTGYGDLVPAGQPGEMIAALEMIIGPAFLLTLVARLVSLWRPGEGLVRRRERREAR
jgi:hypothetical protein